MMVCAGMVFSSCGEDVETILDGGSLGGGDGDSKPSVPSKFVYADMTYTAKAADFAALQAVASDLYVRYADVDNVVRQEPFTGEWEKTVRIDSAHTSTGICAQIIGTVKDREALAELTGTVNLQVDLTVNGVYMYSDGRTKDYSEEGDLAYNKARAGYELPDDLDRLYEAADTMNTVYGGYDFCHIQKEFTTDGLNFNTFIGFWQTNIFGK